MAGTFFAPRYWVSDYWLTDYFGGEEQPAGSIAANLSSAVSVAALLSGIGAASADLTVSFTVSGALEGVEPTAGDMTADLTASFAVSGTLEGVEPTGDTAADLAFSIGLLAAISYTGEAITPPVVGGGGGGVRLAYWPYKYLDVEVQPARPKPANAHASLQVGVSVDAVLSGAANARASLQIGVSVYATVSAVANAQAGVAANARVSVEGTLSADFTQIDNSFWLMAA